MVKLGTIRVYINEKWLKRLRALADDYGIMMSDLFNEIAEWVLDQEKNFRRDLEEELEFTMKEEEIEEEGEGEEDTEESSSEEEEEGEGSEEEEESDEESAEEEG